MSIGPLIQIEPGRFIDGRCVTQVMRTFHEGVHQVKVVNQFGQVFYVICRTEEEATEKATKLASMANNSQVANVLAEQGDQELINILRRALADTAGDNWKDDAARFV